MPGNRLSFQLTRRFGVGDAAAIPPLRSSASLPLRGLWVRAVAASVAILLTLGALTLGSTVYQNRTSERITHDTQTELAPLSP